MLSAGGNGKTKLNSIMSDDIVFKEKYHYHLSKFFYFYIITDIQKMSIVINKKTDRYELPA
jgi:hypothetical protein